MYLFHINLFNRFCHLKYYYLCVTGMAVVNNFDIDIMIHSNYSIIQSLNNNSLVIIIKKLFIRPCYI